MKAISIWQPWASLVGTGAKKIETRSWATKYRGPLLICAAKRKNLGELLHLLSFWKFQGGLAHLKGQPLDLSSGSWPGVLISDLPFGVTVAIVDLVDCLPVEDIPHGQLLPEKSFGDFSPGRFGWIFENAVEVNQIPVVGRQRIFEMDVSVELRDGQPCTHRGCRHHLKHPCEVCGRTLSRGIIISEVCQHDDTTTATAKQRRTV